MAVDMWAARTPLEAAAEANLAAIRGLFAQLKQAVHHANLNTAAVAEAMGVDEPSARSILDGGEDLTLSDLEVLLIAVQARIKLEVRSIHPAHDAIDQSAAGFASAVNRYPWERSPQPRRDATAVAPTTQWRTVQA